MIQGRFTATVALALAVLFVCAAAQAQTPAGTTILLPVYGVSVLPDDSGETPPVTPAMTQNAIPGQTVYFSYNLTNTGNAADSYTIAPLLDAASSTMTLGLGDITIYYDVNGNGVLDGGEP